MLACAGRVTIQPRVKTPALVRREPARTIEALRRAVAAPVELVLVVVRGRFAQLFEGLLVRHGVVMPVVVRVVFVIVVVIVLGHEASTLLSRARMASLSAGCAWSQPHTWRTP